MGDSDNQREKDLKEGRFFAIISYMSFLCVISLLLKKENKFVLFHAKQGLALFVLEVASFILSVIPIFNWLIGSIGFAIFMLMSLWGIYGVLKGRCNRIILVSNIAEKIVL
ncbi:MAG: hypothetical protein PHO70_00805 [Candidatus Omnitrophica bacterium]|nr:hypothetical protein [Candidatus Omnitrophota bacterium]